MQQQSPGERLSRGGKDRMSDDALPPRIGRYEIVGQIAQGGMAQLLLARLSGPGGFERPVVLKRVLRQYAQVREFREMFLDEARIAAGINHPNVVQHFELGESDDELFLVMEYLVGEPASNLARRCVVRRASIPVGLAAHVVACVANGLHAAHESTDLDGNPREIIHRDVSPHNVFLGYDGTVKVLDFGIAKAADRITQTEAGMLKGKYAYMSPEQATGQPLDRRSDVFALGVVLFELTTGRRLFHRATPLASLRAVTDDPIPRPSELVEGYPAVLERVCMKALERRREDRYATAAELRTDLVACLRELDAPADAESALGVLMRQMFDDRIEAKAELLRKMRSGSHVTSVPAGDIDAVEIVETRELPTVAPPSRSPEVPRSPSRMFAMVSIATGLVALSAIAWISASATPSPEPAPETPSPPIAAASTPPSVEPPEPAAPAMVSLAIQSTPAAHVTIGERALGETPVSVELPQSDERLALVLEREGYDRLETEVVADVHQRLSFTLVRARRRDRPEHAPEAPAQAPVAPPAPAFPRFE